MLCMDLTTNLSTYVRTLFFSAHHTGCVVLRAGDVYGEPRAGDGHAVPRAPHDPPRPDAADAQERRQGQSVSQSDSASGRLFVIGSMGGWGGHPVPGGDGRVLFVFGWSWTVVVASSCARRDDAQGGPPSQRKELHDIGTSVS